MLSQVRCPSRVPRACRTVPFFFFNDTATTEIYTLSLHDALPISRRDGGPELHERRGRHRAHPAGPVRAMATTTFVKRSEEPTSELQSQSNIVCRLLLEKKKSSRPAPSSTTSTRPPCPSATASCAS